MDSEGADIGAARLPGWVSMLTALACLAGLLAATDPDLVRPAGPPTLRIDPNTAPPAVISALPRLGPGRVAAIVEAREDRPFDSLSDLETRVKGIGPATSAVLAPYLRFDAPGPTP